MRNDYRHEVKFRISPAQMAELRSRLRCFTRPDPHTIDGKYRIRSLYFDTPENKALREKLDGVDRRQKFRIRFYNGDLDFIRLEKKSRRNGLGTKDLSPLSEQETRELLDGKTDWMACSAEPLVRELYTFMKNELFAPKIIVDYTREPFVFEPGNVRVTLDYNIRAGLSPADFLKPEAPTIPVADSPIILEVKWDSFLPELIRMAVQLDVREGAYSKYASCRAFDS